MSNTRVITLPVNTWVLVNTTYSFVVENQSDESVFYKIASSLPSSDDIVGHRLAKLESHPFYIGVSEKLYARTIIGSGKLVVTEV